LEPEKLTPLLLKKLAAVTKLCPHFHVSLQSGSDKILRAMRRGYTAADFSAIIEHIRAYFPNAGVTTDVMVGFPGETEADFCATQELCRRISFSDMHIFPFSPRKGTPAADMPTQIEKQCKQERARQMRTLAAELRRRFWESQRGKTLMVLPETLAPGGGMAGFSENYIKITARHLTESDANHPTPVTIHAVTAAGCESLRP
jgi:threonylcarbamoyladenosine tRNA methylthiotransferase MtaB